jgi:hypothetical protein
VPTRKLLMKWDQSLRVVMEGTMVVNRSLEILLRDGYV